VIRPSAFALLLTASLACPQLAAAQRIGDSRAPAAQGARAFPVPAQAEARRPTFGDHQASPDVRRLAGWIAASGDNRDMPFLIVDKREAKVFLFNPRSQILGAAPALLGAALGDDSADGIGKRRLSAIPIAERTTPAGRFEAALGRDLEQDVLWIDYGIALSLHRVITGSAKDRRRERLASATAGDNRISYGCINVPAAFYDKAVSPAFAGTVGIVYILPETRPLDAVFAIGG
jgi:hypothetical protein